MRQSLKIALCAWSLVALATPAAAAQAPGPPPPANARVGAPIDLTGQWVAIITEDWRWRMVTPPRGDYASIPISAAGRAAADAWNLAADNAAGPAAQCRAYGAGGLMRIPTRIRISWQDDNTLKLETDAGQQTRLYRFVAPGPVGDNPQLRMYWAPTGERTLQGEIKAQWFRQPQNAAFGGGGGARTGGAMKAVTRHARAGYLRKNGVPYSEDAVITEQFNLHGGPGGQQWITVTTVVDDPRNLNVPFVTSTSFRKETDTSKWAPAPCQTREPLGKPVPPPRQPGAAAPAPAAAAPAAPQAGPPAAR